ncbi:MAG: DUF2905 domain-containing protein [Candidatus Hydrogenedentes bacterium]|nr:DUF2905 domain-containing protein [Candidatus Hydrogenedentota bacterium]
MDTSSIGRLLIVAGIILAIVGLIFVAGGRFGFFGLGKLPGDIRIERDNAHIYFPIVTCIVISLVLTAIFYIVSRLR